MIQLTPNNTHVVVPTVSHAKVAFCGPNGTGKSTLAKIVSEHYNIPTITVTDITRVISKNINHSGAIDLVYESHKTRLQIEEFFAWQSFASDRSHIDDLAESILHNTLTDEEFAKRCVESMRSYTHIFFLDPVEYINTDYDPTSQSSLAYNRIISDLLERLLCECDNDYFYVPGFDGNLAARSQFIIDCIDQPLRLL